MARQTDLGDGPRCHEDPSHGKTVTLQPSGRLWCPVSQTIFGPAIFDEDSKQFICGLVVRPGYIHIVKGLEQLDNQP